jgi:hypothetical protein
MIQLSQDAPRSDSWLVNVAFQPSVWMQVALSDKKTFGKVVRVWKWLADLVRNPTVRRVLGFYFDLPGHGICKLAEHEEIPKLGVDVFHHRIDSFRDATGGRWNLSVPHTVIIAFVEMDGPIKVYGFNGGFISHQEVWTDNYQTRDSWRIRTNRMLLYALIESVSPEIKSWTPEKIYIEWEREITRLFEEFFRAG